MLNRWFMAQWCGASFFFLFCAPWPDVGKTNGLFVIIGITSQGEHGGFKVRCTGRRWLGLHGERLGSERRIFFNVCRYNGVLGPRSGPDALPRWGWIDPP